MHISTHLDVDLVAIDEADKVTCLLELTAPADIQSAARPGRTLVLVLDMQSTLHSTYSKRTNPTTDEGDS